MLPLCMSHVQTSVMLPCSHAPTCRVSADTIAWRHPLTDSHGTRRFHLHLNSKGQLWTDGEYCGLSFPVSVSDPMPKCQNWHLGNPPHWQSLYFSVSVLAPSGQAAS